MRLLKPKSRDGQTEDDGRCGAPGEVNSPADPEGAGPEIGGAQEDGEEEGVEGAECGGVGTEGKVGGVEEGQKQGGEDRAGGFDELDEEEAAEGDFKHEGGDSDGEEREYRVAEVSEVEIEFGVQRAEQHHGEDGRDDERPAQRGAALPLFAGGRAGGESVGGADAVEAGGRGAAGGNPAQNGESNEQEKEQEELLQEVRENRQVEPDGKALGGALGETLGSDDPDTCAEEEQEVEGSRKSGGAWGLGNGLISSFSEAGTSDPAGLQGLDAFPALVGPARGHRTRSRLTGARPQNAANPNLAVGRRGIHIVARCVAQAVV